MRSKSPALAALVTLTVALAAGPLAAVQQTVMPYGTTVPGGNSGFKFTILPLNSQIPGFEAVGFDDSLWSDGIAPFGGAGTAETTCPNLWPTVLTPWSPNNSDLFTRFHLDLCPGARSVRVGVSIDNDVALWVNGNPVVPTSGCWATSADLLCETEKCAVNDKVIFDVPDAFLVGGDNVFAIHARDRHIVAYLDIQVTADLDDAICEQPNEPPVCDAAAAEPGQLWPPNHKWASVGIGGVTDPEGGEIALTVTSIFQDEPVDAKGNGDGNTCPDGAGVGTNAPSVRAERAGGADGRVYHIGFTATDPEGATCQGSVAVCVPHDQGQGNNCIDQGALFDSTVCP